MVLNSGSETSRRRVESFRETFSFELLVHRWSLASPAPVKLQSEVSRNVIPVPREQVRHFAKLESCQLVQGCYKLSQAERRLERCLDDLESQLELEAGQSLNYATMAPKVWPPYLHFCLVIACLLLPPLGSSFSPTYDLVTRHPNAILSALCLACHLWT